MYESKSVEPMNVRRRKIWRRIILLVVFSSIMYTVGIVILQRHDGTYISASSLNQQTDFAEQNWSETEWHDIKQQFKSMLHPANKDQSRADIPDQLCDSVPSKITAQIKIYKYPPSFNATTSDVFSIDSDYIQTPNGRWKPRDCRSRHRVAIVIPYKNRVDNLNYFLTHMHPFLQRQELEYQIFIVEQANDELFNKGILMNAGFMEIMSMTSNMTKDYNQTFAFDCVIFHDVDLLPEGKCSDCCV